MLILRDVHYVEANERCRAAAIVDHGVDVADLHIHSDAHEVMKLQRTRGVVSIEDLLGQFMAGIRYDERGAVGTWHLEDDCPHENNRR